MLADRPIQVRESRRVRAIPALGAREIGLISVAALTIVAAVLRIATLHIQSFDEDEAVTVALLHHSFGGMLATIPHSEQTPPLYYVLAWLWARAFGFSEVGIRSLSAIAGTLLVPVMYQAGKQLVSRRAGIIAAALTTFSPLLFWYSQEARSYALLALLSGLAFAFFARAYTSRTAHVAGVPALWGWAISSSLALATHYFAVFLVLPEAVLLLAGASAPNRRALTRALVLPVATAVALAPLAAYQQSPEKYSFIGLSSLGARVVKLPRELSLGYALPHGVIWMGAVTLVVLIAVVGLARGSARRAVKPCGVLAACGIGIPLLLAVAGIDLVVTRNFIAVLVPCLIAVAAGLSTRRIGVAAAITACAIGLAAILVVDSDVQLQRPAWREAAMALGPASENRVIVVVPGYRGAAPLGIYLPGSRPPSRTAPPVTELDVVGLVPASQPDPLRLSLRAPPAGFVEFAHRDAPAYTVVRYQAIKPERLTPAVRTEIVRAIAASGGPGLGGTVVMQPAIRPAG